MVSIARLSYPIHCSTGGRLGGFTTKGESRRCFSSSGVYLIAMLAGTKESALRDAEDS